MSEGNYNGGAYSLTGCTKKCRCRAVLNRIEKLGATPMPKRATKNMPPNCGPSIQKSLEVFTMQYITLVAQEVVDGKKKEVGKQEKFPIAESIDDILAMENEDHGWNAEEIVACFNYGSRVKRQTQLRNESEAPSNVKVFKSLSPAEQEKILREHGLI